MLTSALLVAVSLAAGQADSPAAHLKPLQPLIGQWIFVGPISSDSEAFGPKGTELAAVISYRWAINRNALQINWSGKVEGKPPVVFTELIGWDGKQKKLVSHGFSSRGAIEHNVWTIEDGVIVCNTKGTDDEGKDVSLRYLHIFKGDTMTFRLADLVVDGQKQPEEEYIYRRIQ